MSVCLSLCLRMHVCACVCVCHLLDTENTGLLFCEMMHYAATANHHGITLTAKTLVLGGEVH